MNVPSVKEAIDRVSAAISADPAKAKARNAPAVRMKVRIGAAGRSAADLRQIVAWADAHSPVGCTMRQAPGCSLDIEIA